MGLPPWRAGKPHFNCSKLAQIWALHRRSWARNKQKRPLQSNCTVKLPISRWSLVSIDLRHCMFAHYFMFTSSYSSYIQRYFGEKWIKVVHHEKKPRYNWKTQHSLLMFVDCFRLPNKTTHLRCGLNKTTIPGASFPWDLHSFLAEEWDAPGVVCRPVGSVGLTTTVSQVLKQIQWERFEPHWTST